VTIGQHAYSIEVIQLTLMLPGRSEAPGGRVARALGDAARRRAALTRTVTGSSHGHGAASAAQAPPQLEQIAVVLHQHTAAYTAAAVYGCPGAGHDT
jgi:hypothetical protein